MTVSRTKGKYGPLKDLAQGARSRARNPHHRRRVLLRIEPDADQLHDQRQHGFRLRRRRRVLRRFEPDADKLHDQRQHGCQASIRGRASIRERRYGDAASFCADAVAFADSSCLLPTPRHRRATTHNPGVDTGTGRRYGDAASFCADAVARVDTRVDTGTQLLCASIRGRSCSARRYGDAASFCADAVAFADSSCLLPTPRHRRATTHNPLNSG